MTSFLISFPDIPLNCVDYSVSRDLDELYPFANTISGSAKSYFKFETATSSVNIDYDMGAGNTASYDHIIIARADRCNEGTNSVSDLSVRYSSDGVGFTTDYSNTSFNAATLYRNVFLYSRYGSGALDYRYWRVRFSTTGLANPTSNYRLSKIYLGNFFDMGREPAEYKIAVSTPKSEFLSSDGTRHFARSEGYAHEIEIIWQGVSDAKAREFIKKAKDEKHKGCFLHTDSYTTILNDKTILHCECLDADAQQTWTDWNIVKATFREYAQ